MGKTLFGSLASAGRGLVNRSPVPYVSGRNISIPWRQPTGAEAQMRAMGTVGTLFAIVNRTSNATAQVNWRLYRKASSGLKEDRVEVTSHAALDLLNTPNRFFTRQELIESTQQHIDLTGEGWWVITRNPRSPIPLELWPVRPDRMAPIPDPNDFIAGYTYTAPDGREIPLRVEDVIQIRMPNPLDPYRGMGPVQSILTEIDSARYSAEWNRNFFLNSAEPGGIIEVEKRLSDPEFTEARDRWAEQHKGVSNAHRVAIIENGMKWVDRKLTQRDMQFAELRQVSRDVIREAFGAPAFVLGEVGDVNRATAEASKVLFAEQLTVPRLERFKGALNNDLLPLYGQATAAALEFDYDDPVPPDAAARNAEITAKTTAWATLVEAGADADLAAEYLGLPELGYTPPVTLQPAAPAPVAAPAPAARLDLHHHVPFPLPAGRPSYNTARTAPRPAPAPARNAAADTALEQVRTQYEDALTDLLTAWGDIEDTQYEELAGQIEEAVNVGDSAALARLTVDTGPATEALTSALGGMATTAAKQMASEAAAQGVKVRAPKVDKRLRNVFGSELVAVAAATAGLLSADMIASAGREALRLFTPGADGADVAGKVTSFLRGLKNWVRRDQLGGALHRAQNIGRLATLAAAPPATYVADERRDANTCGPCAEIDGTEFADLAAAQAVYGAGGYPQCEGGIRCRGMVTAVWDTTEEAAMGRGYRCTNRAGDEALARAARPALSAPDGTQGWYRITNAMSEGGGDPCLYIYGDIGSWGISAGQCVQELSALDAPVIDVYINSPGGEVFDGLAIYNALRSHPAKIMVRVDALAASIASVIAMAGDRVIMSPGSQMMIHDANGVACGEPDELRKYADFLDAQSDNIASIYAERAGGTMKQWRKLMQAETWYFADEAVTAGLADEVAQPARQDTTAEQQALAASWDLSVYNYAHTGRDDAPAPDLTNTASPTNHTTTGEDCFANVARQFTKDDRVRVTVPPHEEGQDTGTVEEINGNAYGITFDGMEDMGVHRWYTDDELEPESGPPTDRGSEPVAVFDPAAFRAAAQAALDPMPSYQPDRFRDLMAGIASDAPAAPRTPAPPPVAPPPIETAQPAAQQSEGDAAVAYFRTLMANAANDLAAPDQAAAPDPAPAEPVPAIDPTAFERSLREARL